MYKQIKFSNGINFISSKNTSTKTATVLAMFKTGSKNEQKNINGISHFLEHIMFKGTKKYPRPHDLSIALDNLGGEFNAYTSEEYTGYWIKVEHSKLGSALLIMSEMLINSTFPEDEINRERGVIIEEMNMIKDDPMRYIYSVFTNCLYGDTPAGRDIIGTKENIQTLQRKDFINYYNSQYNPKNLTIAITGNCNNAEKLALKYFNFENNFSAIPQEKFIINQNEPKIKIVKKKTDQAHLSVGFHTCAVNHTNEICLRIIAAILGGSMSSRLFMELREKKGLAYSVRTFTDFHTNMGYLATNAGVPITKLKESIKTIINEYKKIKAELVQDNELTKVKNIIKGRLAINLEQSDEVAEWFAKSNILRGKILSPDQYIEKINKISAKDIKRVANELFNEKKLNLAIIGDCENEKEYKNLLKL